MINHITVSKEPTSKICIFRAFEIFRSLLILKYLVVIINTPLAVFRYCRGYMRQPSVDLTVEPEQIITFFFFKGANIHSLCGDDNLRPSRNADEPLTSVKEAAL